MTEITYGAVLYSMYYVQRVEILESWARQSVVINDTDHYECSALARRVEMAGWRRISWLQHGFADHGLA